MLKMFFFNNIPINFVKKKVFYYEKAWTQWILMTYKSKLKSQIRQYIPFF